MLNKQNLFIPFKSEQIEALKWRLAIIQHEKIYDANSLVEIIHQVQNKRPNRSQINKLVTHAKSSDIVLDELETTTLLLIVWLSNVDKMSDNSLIEIDRDTRNLFGVFGTKPDAAFLKYRRETLKNHAQNLLKWKAFRIRAKVAFQEVVALLAPDEMIPTLVAKSPVYLGCEFVQHWIQRQRSHSLSKDVHTKAKAKENLKALSKALVGEQVKTRKRKYKYWQICMIYEDLTTSIDGYRRLKKEGNFDQQYFDMWLKEYKIPEAYPNLILDKKKASGQLAMDIMIDQGVIPSEKAFEEIRPFINKMQQKHFKGNMMGIIHELLYAVADFLDVPHHHPEFLAAQDIYKVLEQVPLQPPRPKL